MRVLLVILVTVLCVYSGYAQDKLRLKAERISDIAQIDIDGVASEDVWKKAEITSPFIANSPNPGAVPAQSTIVKVAYDNNAIYVFAQLDDNEPQNIQKQLSQRDEIGNVDWFSFVISPYNDGFNGVEFMVTAAGVQRDLKRSVSNNDVNWNAVWQSDITITETGWNVEMKIPYSAIRFPESAVQEWGVNFTRSVRRTREESSWSPIDPTIDGILNQAGMLHNIKDITPPVRLFFFPYVSGYAQNFDGSWGSSYNGGLDLKYGINDAFTLDITLVPDFGQVQSDNKVLNLSPFEVRFNENRQFFTEGTELFNKGGLFYSRRIGGFPHAYGKAFSELKDNEEIEELPSEGRLINATKLSGRTSTGLGVGVFNAVTRNTYATLSGEESSREVLIDPSSNYNVMVVDQNLKNNSYVTFINTNVTRSGSFYDANVSGVEYRARNKKNTFQNSGQFTYSNQQGGDIEDVNGFAYSAALDKIGGNYNYGISHDAKSDKYDINDLGFLYRNNEVSNNVYVYYSQYKPGKHFNRYWAGLNMSQSMLYKPSVFTAWDINGNFGATTKTFHTFGFNFGSTLVAGADYFEPRLANRYYETPINQYYSGFLSSDYRKIFALDINLSYNHYPNQNRDGYGWFVSPRVRFSDKSSLIYQLTSSKRNFEEGFATFDSTGTNSLLGKRDVSVLTNVLDYKYIFNNKMGLTLRVRHYWSKVFYHSFHELTEDGLLSSETYQGVDVNNNEVSTPQGVGSNFNRNYNSFNVDLVYTWVFAPGSELRVVWKNNIEQSGTMLEKNFQTDLKITLAEEQLNSFSIKLLYFIDYARLKNRSKTI
jgi:hypothetical protein